jgi:hypothetical protein
MLPDRPLCDVAIWITGVIRETANATALGCVDELPRSRKSDLGLHTKGTSRTEG